MALAGRDRSLKISVFVGLGDSKIWQGFYRFHFNGKENIDEITTHGDWQDYGERYYSARLGRFPSPDPLIIYKQKYPELSTYQFASNTPIQAIDLDGLEAFFVHGMKSNHMDWHTKGFQNVADALMKYTNNKVADYSFDWSGKGNGVFQTKISRRKAAELLVKHVLAHKVDGEEITLVGVSHGGNVSIRAARILGKMGYKVNVITLNTPASKNADDFEGPKDNPGINDMIDIRTQDDFVPGLPFGKRWNYNEKVTRQSLTITSKKMALTDMQLKILTPIKLKIQVLKS